MEKQYLTMEQMRHLEELGLDTSDAGFICTILEDDEYSHGPCIVPKNFDTEKYDGKHGTDLSCTKDMFVCNVYTFLDVLKHIPDNIQFNGHEYDLVVTPLYKSIVTGESHGLTIDFINSPAKDILKKVKNDVWIDAAYEMLCWCLDFNKKHN